MIDLYVKRMKQRGVIFSYCSAVLLGSISEAEENAQDVNWPRLRGLNGSGLNHSADLPATWTADSRLWQVEIPGQGHSSPVVYGDRIFLLSAVADAEPESPTAEKKKSGKKKGKAGSATFRWVALCLDKESGSELWRREFPARSFKGHRFNSAASSTATVDSTRVVFTIGTAEQLTMMALSPKEGKELWSCDLGPVVGGHGYGASPVLYEELVILNNDQEKGNGNLLAVHADTGKVAWTVERKSQRISYSVPCVYPTSRGDRLIFTNWQHGFTAIEPRTGTVVADKSVFNTEKNERAISSPVMAGPDLVIGTCGFTANPKHCVAMRLSEGDEWEEVWRIERNVPHIPSVIVVEELAFLIDDSGIATCVEAATGSEIWKERIPGVKGKIFGSPVSDGEKIFFADESGLVHVIAAGRVFLSMGSNDLGEPCKTTPALSEDMLLIRTDTKLTAIR